MPLLVRSGVFSFFFCLGGRFLVCFSPLPEEEISDYLAQGSLIRVLTVLQEEKAMRAVVPGPELETAVGLGVPLVIGGVWFPFGSG